MIGLIVVIALGIALAPYILSILGWGFGIVVVCALVFFALKLAAEILTSPPIATILKWSVLSMAWVMKWAARGTSIVTAPIRKRLPAPSQKRTDVVVVGALAIVCAVAAALSNDPLGTAGAIAVFSAIAVAAIHGFRWMRARVTEALRQRELVGSGRS